MKWSQLKQGWLMNTWEWEEPPGQSQDMLERICLPAGFGTPQCAPRGDWRGGLCVSALTAAPMDPMNMDPDKQQIIHEWMNALSHISVKRLYFFKKKTCKALVKNRSNFHWYSWFNQTKIHKKKPVKIGDISQVDVWIPHSTLNMWIHIKDEIIIAWLLSINPLS